MPLGVSQSRVGVRCPAQGPLLLQEPETEVTHVSRVLRGLCLIYPCLVGDRMTHVFIGLMWILFTLGWSV